MRIASRAKKRSHTVSCCISLNFPQSSISSESLHIICTCSEGLMSLKQRCSADRDKSCRFFCALGSCGPIHEGTSIYTKPDVSKPDLHFEAVAGVTPGLRDAYIEPGPGPLTPTCDVQSQRRRRQTHVIGPLGPLTHASPFPSKRKIVEMKARILWMFFVRASTPSFLILRWPQNRERNQKQVLVGSEEHTEEVLILRSAFVAYRAD